jgi:hypothetical protein
LTDDAFRICDGGPAKSITLTELSEKIARCFMFYQAFFDIYKTARLSFKKYRRFHRNPNFEVFELNIDNKEGLIGFKVHFCNGNVSFFERRKERVMGMNLTLDQGVNFFAGDLDALNKSDKWLVGGKEFTDYGRRYNQLGFWKPILYIRDSAKLLNELKTQTSDEAVLGVLFYARTTGFRTIEFVVKSNKELFAGNDIWFGNISMARCDSSGGIFLYDGSCYLKSISPKNIKRSINKIKKCLSSLTQESAEISWDIKYRVTRRLVPSGTKGKFSITLDMADPRNCLVTSRFDIFPATDWKIKSEWADNGTPI